MPGPLWKAEPDGPGDGSAARQHARQASDGESCCRAVPHLRVMEPIHRALVTSYLMSIFKIVDPDLLIRPEVADFVSDLINSTQNTERNCSQPSKPDRSDFSKDIIICLHHHVIVIISVTFLILCPFGDFSILVEKQSMLLPRSMS